MKILPTIIAVAIAIQIALFPMLEMGHKLLHLLKTRLHTHTAVHQHSIMDHHIEIPDSNYEQCQSQVAMLGFTLVGFIAEEEILFRLIPIGTFRHFTAVIHFYTSRSVHPPAFPPAS